MPRYEGIEACHYSIFNAVTKRTNRDNKKKFNQNLREKAVEAVKPYSTLKNCLIGPSSINPKM